MAKADRHDLEARRRRGLTIGLLFLLMASAAAFEALDRDKLRLVDDVRICAITMLAIVVSVRATTNFTLLKRNPALDDELTRANRASAAAWGFLAFVAACCAALAASLFWPLRAPEALLIVLVCGPFLAAVRFVFLERRAE